MTVGNKIAATFALMIMSNMAPVYAQDESRLFSAQSGEQVNEALTLANKGETQAAVNILQKSLMADTLTPYERSTIYQMIGQYSYALDRPVEAQEAYEKAIQASGLLPKDVEATKIIIAQLMIGNGQYREGAEKLETYLNTQSQQKPEYVELLVKAWVQTEDFKRALPWAEKWFKAASPKERKHYDLLNFLYNDLGLKSRQADIVKQMISQWPEDKDLWHVWASILSNGGREEEAFEVTKIMYLKGMLNTESELLKVVQYYSFYDMPYQAAQILEEEMEKERVSRAPEQLRVLSNLYRQAREYKRAIPILQNVARLSGDAASFAALGEALHNEGECKESKVAFSEAISRGYDAGKSWMLIASCRYDETAKLDKLTCDMTEAQKSRDPITLARHSAIEAFGSVPKHSNEYGNAQTWIKFIEAEKQAVKRRCDFEIQIKIDVCNKQIEQAYEAQIFTQGFKLEDETCREHLADYDAEFRTQKVTSQE